MGNRQINHYAFAYHVPLPNAYCDTVLMYDKINIQILSSIANDLVKTPNTVLYSMKDFVITAMAYLVRENEKKGEYVASYFFYHSGTLILKIVHDRNKIEQVDTNTEHKHIRCDLDLLFASPAK